MYDYLPVLVFMAIGLGIGIAFYAVNTAGSYLGVVPNNPGTTKTLVLSADLMHLMTLEYLLISDFTW